MTTIFFIATAVVLVGGLALVPLTTTQEAYGNHQAQNRNGPNPSQTGIENGGESHGGGLSDHGCLNRNGNAVGHQQGATNSGIECDLESVVE